MLLARIPAYRRELLVLALALIAATTTTTAPVAEASSPRSFLRAPLRADQPLDPNSAGYVAELNRLGSLRGGRYINTREWTAPIIVASADAPSYDVIADPYGGRPRQQRSRSFTNVPIPDGSTQSPGGDGWITIHQPSTDTMWEFWKFYRDARGRWHATAGRRYDRVSESPGNKPNDTDGTDNPDSGTGGAGLALPGGLITLEDMARIERGGRLDHALVFAAPAVKARAFRFPATSNWDGTHHGPHALPYGIAFRLPPSHDVDALRDPITREVARAIRDYGMYLRDFGGALAFFGEMGQGSDPWPGIFSRFGTDERTVMNALPWRSMQAIQPRTDVLR